MNPEQVQRFAAIWSALDTALDWEMLGVLHCHAGGESFFGAEDRQALLETGLLFADDLAQHLSPGGTSLYVGATVAELVPMLVETLVLGRNVLWYELDSPVMGELVRALDLVAQEQQVELPHPSFAHLGEVPRGICDHLWLVSVLTDPEAFPALHDRLYERSGPDAVGKGDLEQELPLAESLVSQALAALSRPAWLSSTDEELTLVRGWIDEADQLDIPERARFSAVVGDPVRLCVLRRRS